MNAGLRTGAPAGCVALFVESVLQSLAHPIMQRVRKPRRRRAMAKISCNCTTEARAPLIYGNTVRDLSNQKNVGAMQYVTTLQMRNGDLSARRRSVGIEVERVSGCVEPEFLCRVGWPGRIRDEMRRIKQTRIGANRKTVAKTCRRKINQVAGLEIGDLVEPLIGCVVYELVPSKTAL